MATQRDYHVLQEGSTNIIIGAFDFALAGKPRPVYFEHKNVLYHFVREVLSPTPFIGRVCGAAEYCPVQTPELKITRRGSNDLTTRQLMGLVNSSIKKSRKLR